MHIANFSKLDKFSNRVKSEFLCQNMVLSEKIETLSLVELLKGLPSIAHDWRCKTAYQKWCYFRSIGKTAFKYCAIPLYEIDQTLNWYSYFQIIYTGLYTVLALYTLWFYINRGEFAKCLPCTCLLIGPLSAVSVIMQILVVQKYFFANFAISIG